jgi:hypothetical protein
MVPVATANVDKGIITSKIEEMSMSSMHRDVQVAEHTFGWAIQALKGGDKVARAGWNGKGMWLQLQSPTPESKMTLPYIYMSTVTGDLVPWLASQTDILATDWGYPVLVEDTIPNTTNNMDSQKKEAS